MEVVFKVSIVEGIFELDLEFVLYNNEFICINLFDFRFSNGLNSRCFVGNETRESFVERKFVLIKYFLMVDFDIFFYVWVVYFMVCSKFIDLYILVVEL